MTRPFHGGYPTPQNWPPVAAAICGGAYLRLKVREGFVVERDGEFYATWHPFAGHRLIVDDGLPGQAAKAPRGRAHRCQRELIVEGGGSLSALSGRQCGLCQNGPCVHFP